MQLVTPKSRNSPKQPNIVEYASFLREVYSNPHSWSIFPPGDWPPKLGKMVFSLQLVKQSLFLDEAFEIFAHHVFRQFGEVNALGKISNFRVEHMFLPNDDIINLEKGLGDTSLKFAQNLRVVRVLIEGAPGVGKTTICRKSCKDWASGSLWPEYKLVVFVPLRNDAIVEATELWQLLDHDSEAFRREVAEEVKRAGGEGLLLLLDGWDEIDPSKIRKTSILQKLLRREILRKCSFIITSRPHASSSLVREQAFDRHFSITGLSADQIKQCVINNFTDKPEASHQILKVFETREDLMNICYIPINLAIVLFVYRVTGNVPRTLTETFDIYIKNVLIRQAQLTSLEHMSELPPNVAQLYHAFCKLAFLGIKHKTLVFSEDAVRTALGRQNTQGETLGLLSAVKSFTAHGIVTKYQFSHLTIQEFLAADYLSQQPLKVQEEFVARFISNKSSLSSMTVPFLFGRSEKLIKLIPVYYSTDPWRVQTLFRLGHESLSPESPAILAECLSSKPIVLQPRLWKPFELHLLACSLQSLILENLKVRLNLAEGKGHHPLPSTKLDQLVAILQGSNKLQIRNLVLTTQVSTHIDLQPFLKSQGAYIKAVEYLHDTSRPVYRMRFEMYYGIKPTQNLGDILATFLQGIDKKVSSPPDIWSFLKGCTSLKSLRLTGLPAINTDIVLELLSQGLQKLYLVGCNVSPAEAVSIFEPVVTNTTLEVLDLSCNDSMFADEQNIALGGATVILRKNNTLKELCLRGQGKPFHPSFVEFLVRQVGAEKKSLYLDHNLVTTVPGERDMVFTLNSIVMNIQALHLSWCGLRDSDATTLAGCLCSNKITQELHLDGNHISAGGAIHLMVALMENTALEVLRLGFQMQPSDEAEVKVVELRPILCEALENVIAINTTLKHLSFAVIRKTDKISYAEVGLCKSIDSPITLLPIHILLPILQHSCSLKELDISGCNLQEPVTRMAVVSFLENNQSISHLHLFFSLVLEDDIDICKDLYRALSSNKTLTELCVNRATAINLSPILDRVNLTRYRQGAPLLRMYDTDEACCKHHSVDSVYGDFCYAGDSTLQTRCRFFYMH